MLRKIRIDKRILFDFYHTYVVRDLIGPIGKHKYESFGRRSRLFKPLITDKNRKRVSIGNNTKIGKMSRIQCYKNERNVIGRLQIGDDCIIGNRCSFLCGEDITIGSGVLIASDVF